MNSLASTLNEQLLCARWPISAKRIGVLKVDRIGDYVLFRNFLRSLREYPAYRGYKIVLIGNSLWKELAERYDQDVVDQFIWVNGKRYKKERGYRLRTIWRLKKLRMAQLIHPTISRDFKIADHLVKCSGAKVKIGHEGDLSNISASEKAISDQFYQRLIGSKAMFEFDVYREFFAQLLPNATLPSTLSLPVGPLPRPMNPYVMLFPGGSGTHKQWPISNFSAIAEHILQHSKYDIVIAGAREDRDVAKQITRPLAAFDIGRIHNIAGTITLGELVDWVGNARGLVTNDTVTVHIGAATGVSTIVIWKGDHAGRFLPYPTSMGLPVHTVMPPTLQANIQQLIENRTDTQKMSPLDIDSITVQQVMDVLNNELLTH